MEDSPLTPVPAGTATPSLHRSITRPNWAFPAFFLPVLLFHCAAAYIGHTAPLLCCAWPGYTRATHPGNVRPRFRTHLSHRLFPEPSRRSRKRLKRLILSDAKLPTVHILTLRLYG